MSKSKPLTIITDRQPSLWEQFLLDAIKHTQSALDDVEGATLNGMYYAAPMSDGRILSGYEKMEPTDLCVVAASAIMDAVDLYMEQHFESFYDRMLNGELNKEAEPDE